MACPYNSNTNNLEQGVLYKSKEKNMNKKPSHDLDLLQNNKGPYKSQMEGFVGSATQIPLDRPLPGTGNSPMDGAPPSALNLNLGNIQPHNSNLDKLEEQFNKLLSQYTTQYKLMSEELIQNNSQEVLQKYANNNVKLNNAYYYINSHGFASPYDQDAWKNRSTSCSNNALEISSSEFNKLLNGQKMGKGQACGVAGFNVENSDNGEKAFVDIRGVRHVYPKEVWDKRNDSCAMNARALSGVEYNSISKGTDMTDATFCERLNVDPKVLQNLANLNKQLLGLGNQMMKQTELLSGKEDELDKKLQDAQKQLKNKLKQLQDVQSGGDGFSFDTTFGNSDSVVVGQPADINRTIEASTRDSQIILRMNYLKYLVGLILVVFLVIFSFKIFGTDKKSVVSIVILLLVILFVLYDLWKYIYRKFM